MQNLCEAALSRIVVTCMESDSVSKVAQLMRDSRTNFVSVTDVTHRVTGVVTDRDLVVRALAASVAADTPIGAILPEEDVISVMPEDSLQTAKQKMLRAGASRVLVTGRHGIALGVVDRAAILRFERRTGQVTPTSVRLGMAS
jgi:signal-transduction protein with cAMP-binding, CBS, and nucleotidyltransferase domain